jgi:hypothetical protein
MVCDAREVYGYQDGYESVNEPLLIAWNKDAEVAGKQSKNRSRKATTGVVRNWQADVPVCVEGLVLTGNTLFMSGSPRIERSRVLERLARQNVDRYDADPIFRDAQDTITGAKGGVLYAVCKDDGRELMQIDLPSIPVFDGLIAADERLYISMRDGSVICLSSAPERSGL